MSNTLSQRSVFPKTYSQRSAFYRPWKATSFTPMPIIDTRKAPTHRHGHLQTPQITPTSSESDSTDYTDSTQFLSLSGQLSQSRITSSSSSSDEDAVTKLNPDAPYHYGQKHAYSIIIEESDDMEGLTSYIRPPEKPQLNVKPKSNKFGRKLPQTKMMRDSMVHFTESDGLDEMLSTESDMMMISSATEGNQEEPSSPSNKLSNIDESPTEMMVSSQSDQHGPVTGDDSLSDVEVMRDAPPPKTHRKRTSRRGDPSSSLKVSAMKLHSPDPVPKILKGSPSGRISTPKRHRIRRSPHKKKALLSESDKGKQVSFSKTNQESLYMPGSRITDTTSSHQLPQVSPSISILKNAVATWNLGSPKGEDKKRCGATTSTPLMRRRGSSRKPNMMRLSFDLSAVPLPSYDDLVVTSVPIKKPEQKKKTASPPDMSVDPVPSSDTNDDLTVMNSLPKVETHQEAAEISGKKGDMSVDSVTSSGDDDPTLVNTLLPKVETQSKTSDGNLKKCNMSVDPVPSSGDNDQTIINSLPNVEAQAKVAEGSDFKKVVASSLPRYTAGLIITPQKINSRHGTSNRLSCESPRIGVDATPSKQLKRESSSGNIPSRPTKKRAMVVSSSDSDNTTKLQQHKQKKRLVYKSLGSEVETCILTRLPDRFFMRKNQPARHSTKPLTKIDMNFFKDVPVPDDILCTVPDSSFQVKAADWRRVHTT